MTSAWIGQLRQASFRGVKFNVDSADTSGGRRTVVHEYPNRNEVFVEDLGLATKEFSIGAFIVDSNYIPLRDSLIRALEQAGSGILVHPYYGERTVVCTGFNSRESKDEGGMVSFSISFVETGLKREPFGSQSPIDLIANASLLVKGDASRIFSELLTVSGVPEFVRDAAEVATQQYAEALELVNVSGDSSALINEITSQLLGNTQALVTDPQLLADLIIDGLDLISGGVANGQTAIASIDKVKAFTPINENNPTFIPTTPNTPNQVLADRNRTLTKQLVQMSGMAEQARIAAITEFGTLDEATSVRNALIADIDELSNEVDDDAYGNLQDLRAQVTFGIPDPAGDLPNVTSITPPSTLPSLVIAYDLYEDADREAEITRRNRTRHPGFVPGGQDLEVLTT